MPYTPKKPEALTRVLKAVCKAYGLSAEEVLGTKKTALLAEARHVFFHVLKKHVGWSYPVIGEYTDRDHTTIMSGVRACEQRLANPKGEFIQIYQRVVAQLSEQDIHIGDVVQISPVTADNFAGAFLVVTDVSDVVEGYAQFAGNRVPHIVERKFVVKIGKAKWTSEE